MSSILLNPLYENNSNKLNNIYNTNIENNMNKIEQNQAYQSFNQPEYLTQFDDLKFDNLNQPVSINNGVNNSLQRNLDFMNGYSEFQQNDMHYNVIAANKFVHNNMTPNTSTRDRDVQGSERNQRALETFTGSSNYYTPKTEKYNLFEPMADLTWVNGTPSITGAVQNRYLPSNKNNNGALPFQNNVKVRPGIGDKNQQGNYAVYRIDPLNVDQLRSEINQKITYENKPLETIKKGEIRSADPTLSKFKMPDFREQKFSDLVPSKSIYDAPKQTGLFTDMNTNRNQGENYNPGPAKNNSAGDGPNINTTKFTEAKKESYLNDNTHAINAIDSKIYLSNTKSFSNDVNQRTTTNTNYKGNISNGQQSYTVDYNDIPLTTHRELLLTTPNNIGSVSNISQNYVFSKDMVLPTTNRDTLKNKDVINTISQDKESYIRNNDKAKMTGRMTTSHNISNSAAVANEKQAYVKNNFAAKITGRMTTSHDMTKSTISVQDNKSYSKNKDIARLTGRMTTSHDLVGSTTVTQETHGYVNNNDIAKLTGRMTTSHNLTNTSITTQDNKTYIKNKDIAKLTGRMTTSHSISGSTTGESHVYIKNNDRAKPTIKQTTLINDIIANIGNTISQYIKDDSDIAKITIKQQTENTKNIGHANNSNQGNYIIDENYNARETTKESTLSATPLGRGHNTESGNYTKDYNDIARDTIKQNIINNTYISGMHGEIDAQISHMASNNMELDERREITTYNRTSNGKKDANGPYINKDTVELNDRLLYTHIPAPFKGLDQNISPSVCSDMINNVYIKAKPVIETSSYYINDNFINTLSNNPLVNDLYHQKNIGLY